MAQNAYISLQLEEVNGSIIRNLERQISWSKQEKRLTARRRRAIVCYGWVLLKAYCWTQAEHILDEADVDEVAEIDGFSSALLAAGYAKLEEEANNSELSRGRRKIKIERFSHENITNKNKLCNDNQRKRNKRLTEREGETSAKNRTHVREKSDAHPHTPIDNIQYNTPSPTYNTRQYNNGYNNSSSHYRYDTRNGNNQDRPISQYSINPEDIAERERRKKQEERESAIKTATYDKNFTDWVKAERGTISIESLLMTEEGIIRVMELVREWKTPKSPPVPEDDDIPF